MQYLQHNIFAGMILAVCCVSASSLAAPTADSPPQSVQDTICRPQFTVDGQSLDAGTGFLFDSERETLGTLVLSAHHLFGSAGGLPSEITWDKLAEHASVLTCVAIRGGKTWRGGAALTIPGAHAISAATVQDIAAFPLAQSDLDDKVSPLKLAKQNPKSGESVWLVARVLQGAPPDQLLHHAVVTYVADDAIEYVFDNSNLIIRATSGAPVVNAAGELVGINVAGGLHNGKFGAVATAVGSLRASIMSAR